MLTVKQFINFLNLALGKLVMYMWGDYGRPITTATITAKAKQYPLHYDAAYQNELASKINRGGIGCDCTGLIKWFLWTGGDIGKTPKYNAATDTSASGWYREAKVRGDISTLPKDRAGLILSMDGHCGVYVGNGDVIECTKGQFGNGVVKTKLSDRKWEKWCECFFIDYTEETVNELPYRLARVSKDCPAYATIDQKQKIGNIFIEDEIMYLGDVGRLAAVIYPTAATAKIAFVDKSLIIVKE